MTGASTRTAANHLNIKIQTVQNWNKKDSVNSQEFVQRSSGSSRPISRSPALTDDLRERMAKWADSSTNLVALDDMLHVSTEKFGRIEITKSRFSKFVKGKCNITSK
ncbi:hypothetical protein BD560DRAFT_320007 [Blakeslea trispora]|nr:hypothetical protein BD560DRAFT_320007 [Blakeslea trispora]